MKAKEIFIAAVVLALSCPLFAQVNPPDFINYQGVLRSSTGAPLTGTYEMVFRLYSAGIGGDEILVDSHTGPFTVTVSGGLFNTLLGWGEVSDGAGPGDYASLSDVFADYLEVHLQVEVMGEVLSPRTPIVSSAYAFNSGRLGGYAPSAFARFDSAGTINADWVNTAFPWSDDEISNVLTIGPGSTIDSSIDVGNAETIDGMDSTNFLNRSSWLQTKLGGLILNSSGIADIGTESYGQVAGGYFKDSNGTGTAYLGSYETGVWGYGAAAGGYFQDSDSSGQAYLGRADSGIDAYGDSSAGYFKDSDSTGEVYAGFGDYGIHAQGSTVGGYFLDSDSLSYAWVGYGDMGILAQGNSMGGFFRPADNSAWAKVGFQNFAIDARGTSAGGYFEDTNDLGCAHVGYGRYGIVASGADAGGHFLDQQGTAWCFAGRENSGIGAYGAYRGGYFEPLNAASYAHVAHYSGYGIDAAGSYAGGRFTDTDTGNYALMGHDLWKITGVGGLGFIQNHPYDSAKTILYVAPEGDEFATYTRGTAKLAGGEARVELGETFKWVTNPDIGLTAYLTPVGAWSDLYVAEKTTSSLLVKSAGGSPDSAFDYIVYGLRIGFEDVSVVQEKDLDAWIPYSQRQRDLLKNNPELVRFTPLERFKTMESAARSVAPEDIDFSRSMALKQAIHQYDPATDGPIGCRLEEADEREAAKNLPAPAASPKARPASPYSAANLQKEKAPQKEIAGTPADGMAVLRQELPCFPSSDPVEEGDVLVMDPSRDGYLSPCKVGADPMVLGVAAGISGSCQKGPAGATAISGDLVPVATSGVVSCKVDAGYGPVRRGDLLVASPTPGHAMRADNPKAGTVIGKALDGLESGTARIMVLVILK